MERELEDWLRERLGPAVGVAVAPLDRLYPLYADEEAHVAKAVERRRIEFSAGRWCARRALAEVGIEAQAIPPGVRKGPVWPLGSCGSITHSAGWCAAVATRTGGVEGLGIDIVDLDEARRTLAPAGSLIAGEAELAAAREALGEDAAAVLFSAKESGIKAMSAKFNRYVEFTEVLVQFDQAGFRASCGPFGAQAEGWWTIIGGRGCTAARRGQ